MTQAYKVRTAFIFLIFCSCYLIALFNLYSIQIKQHEFFTDLANKQYNISVTTMPPRAEMFDCKGKPLAINQDQLAAFVLPKEIKNKQQLIPFLKKHFPDAYSRLAKADSYFMYVKRKLTKEQIELIQESKIEDIHFLKEPSRYYPVACTGHIVGITDIDNIGMFGLEAQYNQQLAGSPTTCELEKDARSGHFYFKKETKVSGKCGTPLQTTIDSDLQFLAQEELTQTVQAFEAKEGAVLVLDPTTGDILVMATYPTFDPRNTNQLDMNLTKNKIVTDVHEPGSVMKVFLAMAAFEEKVVTPDELIDCENTKIGVVNGVKFSTVHPDGIIPFSEVIANSNNFGVAKIALRLGSKLYDHYTRLGFGTKSGLNWAGEQTGFVNAPKNWSRPSIISLSFGYEITASLMQVGLAFGVIANSGYKVTPRIVRDNQPQQVNQRLYSPATITTIRDILEQTVVQGTGKKAALKGYKILGKTGTAKLVIDGQYSDTHNIYTFAGIIEKDNYKRVVVTFVKDSPKKHIYASTVAAPLFEKVAQKVLIHDKIV